MLLFVASFSYTRPTLFQGRVFIILQVLCCFSWRVPLTHALLYFKLGYYLTGLLLLSVGSFSYTPLVGVLCGEFVFVFVYLVGFFFFYTPRGMLCGEFLLHALRCFKLGYLLSYRSCAPLGRQVVLLNVLEGRITY